MVLELGHDPRMRVSNRTLSERPLWRRLGALLHERSIALGFDLAKLEVGRGLIGGHPTWRRVEKLLSVARRGCISRCTRASAVRCGVRRKGGGRDSASTVPSSRVDREMCPRGPFLHRSLLLTFHLSTPLPNERATTWPIRRKPMILASKAVGVALLEASMLGREGTDSREISPACLLLLRLPLQR